MPRDFDGSTGYLGAQGNNAAVSGYPCSISAWVRPDVNNTEMHVSGVDLAGGTTPFIRLRITSSGKASAQARDDGSNLVSADGTTTVAIDGSDIHILATFAANGTPKIYYNGSLENTGSAAGGTTFTVDTTDIGALIRTSPGQFFDGEIGHVAIWSSELSQGNATSLAAGSDPQSVDAANLEAYWTVDTNTNPEPDLVASLDLAVNGTAPDSSPDFPVSSSGGEEALLGSASTGGQTAPSINFTVPL
jgi:hypothetical protein